MSIDERVVQMEFNNRQFESGAKSTLDTLAKLKQGLNFGNSVQSLNNLSAAGRAFSLSGMADGVSEIANRFSNLGIVGMTVIQNLTNAAMNAGINFAKSITIAPITQGLSEYETKMGSITTILTNTASKGTTLKDVTGALGELNTYADQTIYNFAEMARNIGTFTAAGIDLDTSVSAIKGIANLAAASGSNSQQASTAMYQLSQALSTGTVRLMDWNSVVNAGMGGELFQNALKQTARESGVAIDDIIKKNGSFRESLQDGWLSADILNKTLKNLTVEGATDYATQMLKTGKYTQAQADALIKQAKMASEAATQVKTVTQLFDVMRESVQSGWAVSWEYIIGDKNQAVKMLTAVNDAFTAIMAPIENARNEMLKFWNENGGRDAIIEALSNAFKGLKSIISPIVGAFKDIFPPMTGERLVEISKSIRDLTANFKLSEPAANALRNTFKGIFSIFSIIGQVIFTVVRGIASLVGVVIPAGGGFLALTSAIGGFFTSIDSTIKSSGILNATLEKLKGLLDSLPDSFSGFDAIGGVFSNVAKLIGDAVSNIGKYISSGLAGIDFNSVFGVVNGGILAVILLGIKNFTKGLNAFVKDGGGLFSNIKDMLNGVKDSLMAWQTDLKAGTLLKIAGAIALLAGSLFILSTIDPKKMAASLAAITILFAELFASMLAFEGLVKGMGVKSMITLAGGLIGMSVAILLLSFALKNISTLEWDDIIQGLVGIAGMAAILVAAARLMDKNAKYLKKAAFSFILFAGAIYILTSALEKIALLKPEQMAQGLAGVGILMAELVAFMKATDKTMSMKSAAGLLILAVAINTLAVAVQKFGSMSPVALLQGLAALGAVLMGVGLFVTLTGDSTKVISTAIGLTILAVALNVFASAINSMGSMPINTLVTGLAALAVSLFIMGAAMKFMQSNIAGAVSLTIMAGAITMLALALKIIGSMSVESIVKSLLTLVGVLAILGGAAVLLTPIIPALLGLALAIGLLGVGCLAIGGGLLLFSAGLTALAASVLAAGGVIVGIIRGILDLLPDIIAGFGELIVGVANTIVTGITTITMAIAKVILAICTAIRKTAPAIITTVITVLKSLVSAIIDFIPFLVSSGMQMLMGILTGIRDNIGQVTTTAIDIVLAFIAAVQSRLGDIIQAGWDLIVSFINGLADSIEQNMSKLIEAMANLGTAMISGLIKGLAGSVGDAITAVTDVGSSIIGALRKRLDSHSPSREFARIGQDSISGLAQGLSKYSNMAVVEGTKVGTKVISALSNAVGSISDVINSDMSLDPTIRPVLDLTNVENGLNNSFGKTRGINVSGVSANASNISSIYQKGLTSSPTSRKSEVLFNHNGVIRVEGVNDEGELVAVKEMLAKDIAIDQRRFPARGSVIPI